MNNNNNYYIKYFVNKISMEYGYNKKTVKEILEAFKTEAQKLFIQNPDNRIILQEFVSLMVKFAERSEFTDFGGKKRVNEAELRVKATFSDKFKEKVNESHKDIIKKLSDKEED